MVSAEKRSRATDLLRKASACDPTDEDHRLTRSLLIAAALREALAREPVVVGGTAEDYWTADEYHQTDLDLVRWSLADEEQELLGQLGFAREGRHWIHSETGLPVEFPESVLRGDPGRVAHVPVDVGVAAIIGAEDLYLDRVRQSTMDPESDELQTYRSALAIAASNMDTIDWAYVDAAIRGEEEVGALMRKIHRRIRRRLRDAF